MIHQVYSKNQWLLLSVPFTAKLELVFVLTFENDFLRVFNLKPTERAQALLKKVLWIFKIALRLRDWHVFM